MSPTHRDADRTTNTTTDTMSLSFHNDNKFCPCCDEYVRYLASIEHSYCVECGGVVRLFSAADWGKFQEKMEARKPKGGRPRKGTRRTAVAAAAAAPYRASA